MIRVAIDNDRPIRIGVNWGSLDAELSARLINALIEARKPYELMLFPDERHSPRRLEDRVFMEERVRDFFLENL